jgi:plasmid stabilization system protein ParE
MNKTYIPVLTRFAEDDIVEILDCHHDINHGYMEKLLAAFESRIAGLSFYPEKGRIVPELERQNINDYRELIEGNYRIIYSIRENRVIVLTVIDARRNCEELIIKKLLRMNQ